MISVKYRTIESAWQAKFKLGLATTDVAAFNCSNYYFLTDPVGIHFVKQDGKKLVVLGYNIKKETIRRFLEKCAGDNRWCITRPDKLGIKDGIKIKGRVYKTRPVSLNDLYPGALRTEW